MRQHAAGPERVALLSVGSSLSYARLDARIDAVVRSEAFVGMTRGETVALHLADPIELLVALLAVDRLRGVPLVCDGRWSVAHTAKIIRALGSLRLIDALSPVEDHDPVVEQPAEPTDLAWAGFSSGSTGAPRAIVRARASWTDSYEPFSTLSGMVPDDVLLLPQPLSSSLSMFAALHALWLGATLALPAAPSELEALLATATIVHATPTALRSVLELVEDGAPSSLRRAVVGGAELEDELRRRTAARSIGLMTYYGAAELSFVAADVDGHGLFPFPGVDIRVDPLPGGEVGMIWARSPYRSDGYLGGVDGPFELDAEGWATVGDLAGLEPGALRLRGRSDGAILTGGATVIPEDVERVLRSLPGIHNVVVFGMPHERFGAIVCAVVETDHPDRRAWQEACRAALTIAQRPRRWFVAEALPLTATGKPERARILAAAIAQNEGVRRLD